MNFLESLMESVDGEGNPHWKRDLVVAISLILVAFSMILLGFVLS